MEARFTMTIIQTFLSIDNTRKVEIVQHTDGTYGFTDLKLSQEEGCWCPVGRHSDCHAPSPDIAVREARGRVKWLHNAPLPTVHMAQVPSNIAGAKVVCFSPIDERHRATGYCRHFVGGDLQGPAACIVVCQYPGESGFYLFYCDARLNVITDTWHNDLDAAKSQAELEYNGLSQTWETPEDGS